MPTLAEALAESPVGPTQIHDALVAGLDVLSQSQTVDFTPYVRTVLPIDGFVFWLRADLLPAATLAANGLPSSGVVSVPGSLHYATTGHMVEDETIAIRKVDFAAQQQITAFAEIAPTVMYVARWTTPLGSFRFTFSARGTYYQQADIHHYVGDAIYPVFEKQLIDDISQFDERQIVSNSLPFWLQLQYRIPYVSLITFNVDLYPAYLVPPNLVPPYGTVDIIPQTTRAVAAAPWRGQRNQRAQLCAERARITLYGLRNDEVMDWVDYVYDYVTNVGSFGITNMPVVVDDRRGQVELAALAQKKYIDFEVSYLQNRARDVAVQVIQTALLADVFGGDVPFLRQPDRIIEPREFPSDPLKFPI